MCNTTIGLHLYENITKQNTTFFTPYVDILQL